MTDALTLYEEVTDGLRRPVRVSELVYQAAELANGALPTRAQIDAERAGPQKDKQGLELAQGDFLATVLADDRCGCHLVHSTAQPTAAALNLLDDFKKTGTADLGPMRVDREGSVGLVTIQNHAHLNAEDDASTAAMEIAVDLVLLDDAIEVGVLRGAPATHPKHAGRRIFGAGINLTFLYHGKISLVEFFVERELGAIHKMYRGHPLGSIEDGDLEERREKPWIAAVESFAIGGACQWLLIMDRVVAEEDAYFNLPARKEGIIPGCANLRLPRVVGERPARHAIFFNRDFAATSPEGRMIADEVVPADAVGDAARRCAADIMSAGPTSLVANRRQLRLGQEPVDRFRRYMALYSREQARCIYAPALIDNLERHWNARSRAA